MIRDFREDMSRESGNETDFINGIRICLKDISWLRFICIYIYWDFAPDLYIF